MSLEAKWHIEALLDKPTTESMGMHGLVISDPSRELYKIAGINSLRFAERNFQEYELYHLIGAGALRSSIVLELEGIDAPDHVIDAPHGRWAGLYVGVDFSDKAKLHALETEPLIADTEAFIVPGGTLELGTTDVVYHHIDNWLSRALRRIVECPDREVAALMTRCDSANIKSLTANWLTAPNEDVRSRDIAWVLRLSRDNNWDLPADREGLEKRYQEELASL